LKNWIVVLLAVAAGATPAFGQKPPLLPEPTAAAIAQELSGETAKRNLEFLARLHRQRGSRQFHEAAEFIAAQARRYGLTDAHVEQFPADGVKMYGTQKARLPWDAEFAELWELKQKDGQWTPAERLASFDAMPVTLAEDSESGDVTADLVDASEGTSEGDYARKDVRGKLVLVAAQPGEVERLAIEQFGAAGIISYAQNQPTAWSGEDENLIRWGHLESFPKAPTFAFMVSLKRAREFRQRLAKGETIRLHATVRAGRHQGFYEVVTGTIPGADPRLREEEIVFSCHLDHERPGANDNASGCVTILEVARTISKLIAEGRIPRPARTLRFIWPPEIEGTLVLLNGKPELAPHIKAVIHMDMVGGGPNTKAVFHVTRSPASLPTFINDVAEAFADFVNRETYEFAATGHADYPFVASEGGKEPLLAQFSGYTPGSDHDVYCDGSYGIPAIYLNDWPDRYIHTDFDSAASIDPTKLLRAGFIGAASGYFLANLQASDLPAVWQAIRSRTMSRIGTMIRRRAELPEYEAENLARFEMAFERAVFDSLRSFAPVPADLVAESWKFNESLKGLAGNLGAAPSPAGTGQILMRSSSVRGPMSVFGYDYFVDHYGAERAAQIRLLKFQGLRGEGGEYAYEALNFVDGKRSAQDIRDAVSAEFGPIPFELVAEYLKALESIGVIQSVR
jgi:aminopeptidase YwaD